MRRWSQAELWYGRSEVSPPPRVLEAGPLSLELVGADFRSLRWHGREFVRRLHVAVRDRNWDTVPGVVSGLTVASLPDGGLEVVLGARHTSSELDFAWEGRITAAPSGQVTYEMSGQAKRAFLFNRIGFCVLHPPEELCGRLFRASAGSARAHVGTLPDRIAPQTIVDGTYMPLFPAFDALEIEQSSGLVRFAFEGDLFEMEDQRNWTDASFKTYGTPLSRGFPHQAVAEERSFQRVTVAVAGSPRRAPAFARPTVSLTVGEACGEPLPAVGLGLSSEGQGLSARDLRRLAATSPDHLRVDLHLSGNWRDAWESGLATAGPLGCPLELALFLGREPVRELDAFAQTLQPSPPVARVLVFHEAENAVDASWVRLARERLGGRMGDIPGGFVGGTNVYFTEINFERPQVEHLDGVAWSLNPQVHAFDEGSLVQSLAMQAETVRSARAFCAGKPLIVSPVTLRPRFNPHAAKTSDLQAADALPRQVDPRQMSLFGAAWTLGSLKALCESGAASLTYYETTGWRGLFEPEDGPVRPAAFPSAPGCVFPLWHVFADLAQARHGGENTVRLGCESSAPETVVGLALRTGGQGTWLLANLSDTTKSVHVRGPGVHADHAVVRLLDEKTAPQAMTEPEVFRETGTSIPFREGVLALELGPLAYARVQVGSRG